MLEKLTEPWTWKDYVPWVVAIILALERLTRFAVETYRNRGKPKAEIHESRARAAKEFAEAEEITVRASLTLGEEAAHWTRKMMKAQQTILEVEEKSRRLEEENKRLRNERNRIESAG